MANTDLISEKEVMDKLKVSSRMTIWTYTHKMGFPKPVRSRPKLYLLAEVDSWILNGGVNQRSA
ncbi:helix-turn-helix transcriptional regulator [Pantoea septica]|uniref:helix-turn-helix transcriptional regulator n=1 Tax=Pantoea septica TaxID=472695 RepID=UPI0028982B02|nr:AlpA family transcriptional regulator [Pantoea septica]